MTSSPPLVPMSQKMSFFQLLMMVAAFVVINAVVLYAATVVVPQQVVLGNHVVTPPVAAVMAAVVLAFMIVGSLPLLESASELFKFRLKDSHQIVIYFVLNVLAIWLIARFAELIGLGLQSWVVAVGLGFVLNLVQGVVIKSLTTPVR